MNDVKVLLLLFACHFFLMIFYMTYEHSLQSLFFIFRFDLRHHEPFTVNYKDIFMLLFVDCFCGVEVNFAEVLEGCIESLKATQPPEVSSESSNLTNIKSAAAAGLLSSKVRALMNNLLQHKCIDSNHTSFDHALEEMRCFAAIAVCFDLVTSAELHSVVCKIILDIAEEFIKLGEESKFCNELSIIHSVAIFYHLRCPNRLSLFFLRQSFVLDSFLETP